MVSAVKARGRRDFDKRRFVHGRGRRGFDKRRFVHGRGRRGFDNRRFVHGQLNIRMSMDTFETSMDLQV